ncbi:universal stress protein [Afifella sp. IM 167]|uniref:universal stress protein n=1 Tax=Afifella sp. IM 167 TaxID=2033586 RepID=UPI001CCF7B38|nr:universal stress protein [Afifella sp. IM 167]MBZ8134924.1 universal stress protein UspA [Afifella sp. IM 167]
MAKRILLPIDLDHVASWEKSVDMAIDLARHFGAELVVLSVFPEMEADFEQFPQHHVPAVEAFRRRRIPPDIQSRAVHRLGTVARGIRAAILQEAIDLVVMASHNPSLGDYVMGSNAANVVLHSPCSVLVVR